ncbi:GspH/FimT family pseudopilin [Thioalkalicoccus limnaeus]|uniref:Type II secretion system protein H n=1 Tax=Thioalkalicoccus limnaeus TaxID=120681 RepID=A0ABV4BEI5_9GAMM
MVAKPARRALQGVTLIELLVTLSIVAVLLTIGVPPMADLIARNRMATSVNGLLAHLQLARSEAVKRGVRVFVCPSHDGLTCTGGYSWHQGYLVTLDPDDPDGVLRRSNGTNPAAIQVTTNRLRVTYQPDGTSGGSNLTFRFCDQRAQAAASDHRRVIVSNVGRPRTQVPTGTNPCA